MWIWNDVFHLVPLREFLVGKFYHLGPLLWLVTIFFLILTAAAAVSIFGLEVQERDGEFTVRKMLGATPGRLFRSLNIEMTGILLSALAASLVVRFAVLRVTVGYLQLPFSFHSTATWRDLVMATGAVGTIAIWMAVAQGRALGVFGSGSQSLGKPPDREKGLRAIAGLRFPLQVVPATILLVTAVFLVRSAYAIKRIDPGVRASGAFVGEVVLPYEWGQYVFGGIDPHLTTDERDRQVKIKSGQFHQQMDSYFSLMLQSIRGRAGVTDAGVISLAPYRGYPAGNLNVYVSHEPQQSSNSKLVFPHMVSMSSGAMRALGMRLIYGRNFSDQTKEAPDRDTVIINEAMAERLGPGASALGQYVILGGPGSRPARIVGIVQNVHEADLFAPVQPTAYFPFSQYGLPDVDIVFHTSRSMDFQEAHSLIESSVRSVVPGAILLRFSALEDMVWSAGTLTRYSAYFLMALAVLGVLVAGICSWARIVADTRRREHEIGIRLALGAEAGQLVRLIVSDHVKSSLLSASMGAVIAWWFARLVGFLLYGVNASGVTNYALSIIAITAYVLLISSWAVRGTARRNPGDLIRLRSF
jgi:putative ABC transport system permease protein